MRESSKVGETGGRQNYFVWRDRRPPVSPLLILILLPAFWLRIYLLDGQSLWWDEGISLHLATSSFAEIVANRITNIHPPLYFFLLKIWVSLLGITAFAARYFSVLASFLQMALVFAVLRRWFGRQTAVIGLVLTAVWSLSIIYAQEVRVYAFLPLVYLILVWLTQRVVAEKTMPSRLWFWLGLWEWIALHLHYNALFLLIFLNVWATFKLWRKALWRNWAAVQVGVGLASLPWAVGVLLNWEAVQAEANLAGFTTQPPAWDFVLPQVWAFHLTGLVNVLSTPLLQSLSLLLILLVAVLLGASWRQQKGNWSPRLLLIWLGPLWLGFAVWLVRSYSHPRYISLFASGLVLLLAFLLTPTLGGGAKRWQAVVLNLLKVATAVIFFYFSGWGLVHYFYDPAFAKDDMRAVAAILADEAAPEDLILVPRTDWSLPFTYVGNTPIRMADAFHQGLMWADLAQWTAPTDSVFTLDYADNLYDWQGVVPFALESAGSLVNRWRVDDLTLSEYRLDSPVAEPELVPRDGRFGNLAFLGSWVSPSATTADGVTVAMRWQLLAPVTHNYSSVLNVDDGIGLDLARTDDQLLTANGRPTNRWEVGEIVTTYHFLPFIMGTPPLNYDLSLRVYIVQGEVQTFDYLDAQGVPQGQSLDLGTVMVARPFPRRPNIYNVSSPYLPLPEPLMLVDGLLLTQATLNRAVISPGQPLLARLQWLAETDLPELRPQLVLRQGEQLIASNDDAPALGQYPTNLWEVGERVLEQRSLTVPAMAAPGIAEVFIELGRISYQLGEVEILAEAHDFAPPSPQVATDAVFGDVARLVGFDPPPATLPAGEPVPLTLYWESLSTGEPVAYTVFTQLLAADGRLIAQHDSVPGNGSHPTTGWLEGEFIRDEHLLMFREPGFVGEGQIIVGLYDPETGGRLQLPDGRDAFPLPITFQVEE